MKRYQIYQGKFSESGVGDYELMEEFDTLKEAREYFNKIKRDKRGYSSFRTSDVLETWLIRNEDWENPVGYWAV